VATAAQAQDTGQATELDKVVVTGSLIPQAEVETATPVQSITAEDIQRQGFRDVYDVLRSQPLATGAVQDSQVAGSFTPSAEPISLLGLDPGFTLVLIDGRPLADYPLLYNGQSNFVDLASIPTSMVERIDIAPGNQSSIYGSSAIAGVVNIIHPEQRYGSRTFLRSFIDFDDNFATKYIDPGADACQPLSRLFNGSTIHDERPERGFYCGSRKEVGYTSFMNREYGLAGYLNARYAINDSMELYGTLLANRNKTENNGGSRFWQA
jgi:hypothetical protein